jgi:hypothetical protein
MLTDLDIRRVIEGRVYDTETAQFVRVLYNSGGHIALDFHADYTALYRTRRGTERRLRSLEALSERRLQPRLRHRAGQPHGSASAPRAGERPG